MEDKTITSLKLSHEELKLKLQITWTALLSLSVSLIIGSFTGTIEADPLIIILLAAVIILGGTVLTLSVFSKKFDEIRENIDKKESKRGRKK